MSDLLSKSNDWLNPHGYSIFHKNQSGTWANYVNYERKSSIQVFIENWEFMCQGSAFIGNTMIEIKTPKFQLLNKNIFYQLSIIDDVCADYDLVKSTNK